MLRKILGMLCGILWGCVLYCGTAYAEEAEWENTKIEAEGRLNVLSLSDNNTNTYVKMKESNVVIVSRTDGIGALYIKFDRIPQEWQVTNPENGETYTCGENDFLHEYIDVSRVFGEMPQKLELAFEEGTVVADIFAFSEGEVPAWVQKWEPPCEVADLLLISSHSDDEQLFFLGLLPYYAGELGMNVQVAYVIQHFENGGIMDHQRPHEQLDGLWTVGVKNYPVMSDFPDLYAQSKNRQEALKQAESVFEAKGITHEDFVAYMTECIRRFKPVVVVSHDLDGEYGHGTHVLAADALTEAIELTGDSSQFTDSAKKYGVWEIDKLYLHLYEENPIIMDYDKPLENFGGKTAYEVSCEGFMCHKSQHWTWFYKWIFGSEDNPYKKASQIKTYSPCKFGLYYSNVGNDTEGGNFFENVDTHEEDVQQFFDKLAVKIINATDKTSKGVFE